MDPSAGLIVHSSCTTKTAPGLTAEDWHDYLYGESSEYGRASYAQAIPMVTGLSLIAWYVPWTCVRIILSGVLWLIA